MSYSIRPIAALLVALLVSGCHRRHEVFPSVAQQQVQYAANQAEAERVLQMWDGHLSRAKELADRGDHRRAMSEIESALRLVKRFGIREEGATYHDAYDVVERIPGTEKPDLLRRLLADEELIESKDAIISQAVVHLQLDGKAREQLAALPQTKQVEFLRNLLEAR